QAQQDVGDLRGQEGGEERAEPVVLGGEVVHAGSLARRGPARRQPPKLWITSSAAFERARELHQEAVDLLLVVAGPEPDDPEGALADVAGRHGRSGTAQAGDHPVHERVHIPDGVARAEARAWETGVM